MTGAINRRMMKQTRFPSGWGKERVRKVLVHYEEQTEEEVIAEDEANSRQPEDEKDAVAE